jgi:hypothetical protein
MARPARQALVNLMDLWAGTLPGRLGPQWSCQAWLRSAGYRRMLCGIARAKSAPTAPGRGCPEARTGAKTIQPEQDRSPLHRGVGRTIHPPDGTTGTSADLTPDLLFRVRRLGM